MRRQNKNKTRLNVESLEARRLLSVYADFNGDGRDDLAIGVPGEDSGAGMVQVLYGSATGLTATGSQTMTQGSLGTDTSEAGDNFGAALSGGDFNNDGFADLAVGVPGEDIGAAVDAGAVHFIFGSASGLTGAGDYIMHEDINRVRDIAETGELFGTSLAAGDFDNDGFADLGIGVPGQDIPGKVDAGGVHIFYGGGQGIKPPGNQTFNLDSPGMLGTAAAGDRYGWTLATGNFDGLNGDDLAIGIPFWDFGAPDRGGYSAIYSGSAGLSPVGSDVSFLGESEDSQAGSSLTSGDFDGDGLDDLAIGAPFYDNGVFLQTGFVHVAFGTPTGLFLNQGLSTANFGLPSATDDNFGAAVASADFDNDGFDDLAIGIPRMNIGSVVDAGAVLVAFGSPTGIVQASDITLSQTNLGQNEETDDHFGETLSAGDFNGNGFADLAIGTPDENVVSAVDGGAVFVLYGGASFTGGQTWTQDTAGIADTAEAGDSFGGGLDAGGGKSAPGGGYGRQDLAHLITADFELESLLTKPNKRRTLSGRR